VGGGGGAWPGGAWARREDAHPVAKVAASVKANKEKWTGICFIRQF